MRSKEASACECNSFLTFAFSHVICAVYTPAAAAARY